MASTLAMVMKRLYAKGEVTLDQVKERVEGVKGGKITKPDYEYITGEKYAK